MFMNVGKSLFPSCAPGYVRGEVRTVRCAMIPRESLKGGKSLFPSCAPGYVHGEVRTVRCAMIPRESLKGGVAAPQIQG
ncbi:hypothetical protein [Brevibacillus nitrificans]|uniref:hypothetical protein n=1 Tax=Brevibacillus nitrificans TaxID=651560 RepID=UPI0016064C02|nr:hypothetical protein [Brevibacillus nitrificans]